MTPKFISFVETLFSADFLANHPNVPIEFPNFTVTDEVSAFVSIHVLASEDVFPINLGITAKSRNVGLVQVDVYTPKDTGAGQARELAYAAGNVFKRKNFSVDSEGTVVFKDPSIQDRGQERGHQKYMMRVPYRYDFTDFAP